MFQESNKRRNNTITIVPWEPTERSGVLVPGRAVYELKRICYPICYGPATLFNYPEMVFDPGPPVRCRSVSKGPFCQRSA